MSLTPPPRVPILVYHHVLPDEVSLRANDTAGIIGVTEFIRQLNFIGTAGWTTVSTSRLVDWLLIRQPLPERSCVIHFDNGWLDTFTIARPILRDLEMVATCFPITSGLDAASTKKCVRIRTQTEGWVEKPFMTWPDAAQLIDDDWELGAHTHTHCKLADRLAIDGDAGVLQEAEVANNRFERELGHRPLHFAYPSGSHTARTDELLSKIYRSLRLWSCDYSTHWTFTDECTSVLGMRCQNIDSRVSFHEFERIFSEAAVSREPTAYTPRGLSSSTP